jgi:hypothetical protein
MKDRGEKNLLSYLFFGAINFTTLNNFIFEMLKKKIWANFQRIIELFTQKIVTKLSKMGLGLGSGIRDPGSEKNLFRIPVQGSKRHRIPDPGPQHCKQHVQPYSKRDWTKAENTRRRPTEEPGFRIRARILRLVVSSDPGPQIFESGVRGSGFKISPDPCLIFDLSGSGLGRSQWRPGCLKQSHKGSIDQWSPILITLRRSRIKIRITVNSRIRPKNKKICHKRTNLHWLPIQIH